MLHWNWGFPFWGPWHAMQTQPLLFDDCLSLLQKVDKLWARLKQLIDDVAQLEHDGDDWRSQVQQILAEIQGNINIIDDRLAQVEQYGDDITEIRQSVAGLTVQVTELSELISDLGNLPSRVGALESDVSVLRLQLSGVSETVAGIGQTVTQLAGQVDMLADRVTGLYDLMSRLRVQPPVPLITDDSVQTLLTAWYSWFRSVYGVPVGSTFDRLTPTNILGQVQAACRLNVGYLGGPIIQAKFPLMAYGTAAGSDIDAVVSAHVAEISTWANRTQTLKTSDFMPFAMEAAMPYDVYDEYKFSTSYIPFTDPIRTGKLIAFHVSSTGVVTAEAVRQANNDVRFQLVKDSDQMLICVTMAAIYVLYEYEDDHVRFTLFGMAENF